MKPGSDISVMIAGTGAVVSDRVLKDMLDTTDQWIDQRTGTEVRFQQTIRTVC